MFVKDVMKSDVAACNPQDDLATAGKIMRDRHCGFVPVVDSHGVVAGVSTDRDICLYAAAKPRTLSHLSAKDAMSHPVFSCFSDENLKVTIATMAKHHVRRLPVLDKEGHLRGVLSMDDVVQAPHLRGAPTAEEIVAALNEICATKPAEIVSATSR